MSEIETERLLLRPFRESDAADVLEYLSTLTKEKLANMVKRIIVDGDLRKGDDGAPVNLG